MGTNAPTWDTKAARGQSVTDLILVLFNNFVNVLEFNVVDGAFYSARHTYIHT